MLSPYDLLIILFAAYFSAAGYKLAKEKGRKSIVWAILCFAFPFCLPILIFLKNLKDDGKTER